MSNTSQISMQVRHSPSRPNRLGTRRRKPLKAASDLPKAGATRREAATSLDTEKQLETTGTNWLKNQLKAEDKRKIKDRIHDEMVESFYRIWRRHADMPYNAVSQAWLALYEDQKKKREGEDGFDVQTRVKKWVKENKPPRDIASTLQWERAYGNVRDCQKEWIVFTPTCCAERTRPVATPIGCNHRLCPYCAARRSELAQRRVEALFSKLTHPAMITLTVPNIPAEIVDEHGEVIPGLRKHHYTLFRQRVRQFIKQHNEWIKGGVYSLETTFNRRERSWHIHVHILADLCSSLPSKNEKTELAGEKCYSFTAIKLKLEFDWMRLWGKSWGKMAKPDAQFMRKQGDTYIFEEWVKQGREMRLREFRAGEYRPIRGLSASEISLRTAWNTRNRRVIDVRPVSNRKGAAREVLKYITKVAQFSDLPDALESFANAVRGARLIQTFGSWYGVKLELDTDFDTEKMDDWHERKCSCGLNMWQRVPGTFCSHDVEMDSTGKYHVKAHLWNQKLRGTISRPTIRALATSAGKEAF
ncbi:MAG: hypothetical protein WB424_02900 [Terracidiphilus sp.]